METILKIANLFSVSTDFLIGRGPDFKQTGPSDIDAIINDPELGLWFKDIKDASSEKREELKKFWEFIKLKEEDRKS